MGPVCVRARACECVYIPKNPNASSMSLDNFGESVLGCGGVKMTLRDKTRAPFITQLPETLFFRDLIITRIKAKNTHTIMCFLCVSARVRVFVMRPGLKATHTHTHSHALTFTGPISFRRCQKIFLKNEARKISINSV